jgi:hypothetical protein
MAGRTQRADAGADGLRDLQKSMPQAANANDLLGAWPWLIAPV